MLLRSHKRILQPEEATKPPRFLTPVMDELNKYKDARAKLTKAGIEYSILKLVTKTEEKVTGLEVFCDETMMTKKVQQIKDLLPGYQLEIKNDYIIIK